MEIPKFRTEVDNQKVQVVELNFMVDSATNKFSKKSKGYFLEGENKGFHTDVDLNKHKLFEYTRIDDDNGDEIYENDKVRLTIRRYSYDGETIDTIKYEGIMVHDGLSYDIQTGTHSGNPIMTGELNHMALSIDVEDFKIELI